jgi:hypothetical protein
MLNGMKMENQSLTDSQDKLYNYITVGVEKAEECVLNGWEPMHTFKFRGIDYEMMRKEITEDKYIVCHNCSIDSGTSDIDSYKLKIVSEFPNFDIKNAIINLYHFTLKHSACYEKDHWRDWSFVIMRKSQITDEIEDKFLESDTTLARWSHIVCSECTVKIEMDGKNFELSAVKLYLFLKNHTHWNGLSLHDIRSDEYYFNHKNEEIEESLLQKYLELLR